MQPAQRNTEVLALPEREAREEHLVNELIGCMVDLEIEQFEQLLQANIQQKGIVNTLTHVIFLFLSKTGILWQTGHINPAHEHIVTNIIRQKLVAATESLPAPVGSKPLLLLLLPEGEHHELGLLFVYYMLKQKGLKVIYLGANVPLKDAHYVIDVKRPSHVYFHLSSVPIKLNFQKFIGSLSAKAPQTKILLSGVITEGFKKTLPPNLTLLQSLPQVLAYISTI